jgi:molecular chaperone DnaK
VARDWISIDYGTSNTVAVLCRADGRRQPLLFDSSPLLPSAVHAAADGRVLVGRDAERNARTDPGRFEGNPKRRIDETEVLLGEQAVAVHALIGATLRRVAEEATRISGGPVGDVVLTHPVAWGPTRRATLTRAAAHAGLTVRALVPEPVAAAAYFTAVLGHHIAEGRSILVYDLGAGTFDATVLQHRDGALHTLASQGLDDVGGLDLDALVVAHIGATAGADAAAWQRLVHPVDADDRRNFAMLWQDVRQARESLSRESTATVYVPRLGRDVIITREELERAATPLLHRTVALAAGTLHAAGVAAGDLAGCFLVGGTSRTPIVSTLLHRAIGIPPTAIEDPQLVVAAGAVHASGPAPAGFPQAGPAVPAGSSRTGPGPAEPVSVEVVLAGPDDPVSGAVFGSPAPPVTAGYAAPAPVSPAAGAPLPPAAPPVGPAPVPRPGFPPPGYGPAPGSLVAPPASRVRRVPVVVYAVAALAVLILVVAGGVVLRDKFGGGTEPNQTNGAASRSAAATPAGTSTGAQSPAGVGGTPAALAAKPSVGAGTGTLKDLTVTTLVQGTGPKVTRGQIATVNYVGVLYPTGEEFDASWTRNQTFQFEVGAGNVIAGFDAAVLGATVGSRVQADIPADLAYGTNAAGGAPSGPLRFVIDILAAR